MPRFIDPHRAVALCLKLCREYNLRISWGTRRRVRASSARAIELANCMTRSGLIATCFVCFLIARTDRAHGLDPSKRLTQYRHNVWRVQDGFFPGSPASVTQTADGYLWVVTWNGVFRFDGVRFVPWLPPQSASNPIYLLVPAKSGGFWISDGLGLSHIRGNRIVSHINVGAPPGRIVEEEDGSLWMTTLNRAGSPGPLCHATDQEVRCFGKADGLPIQITNAILPDGTGGFWIGSDTSLVHWKAGVSEIYEPQALKSKSGQEGIFGLVRNSDDSLWVGMATAGRGLGLERFRNGSFTPFSAPNFDGTKISVLRLLLDRDGNLWVATGNNGLYRIHGNTVDHFGLADGLSGNSVKDLYEDQEGVIWAATSNGLDSFREPRVTTYSETEGLEAGGALSVTVSHDGTVWLAGNGSLDSIRNGAVVSIEMKDGLPGNTVTSLLEDREGHLWVGVDDGLYIYENRHFHPVPSPNRGPMGMVVGITQDIDGNIWAECASKPRKLLRIRDFKVQEEFLDSQVPAGHTLTADPKGGIWLGTLDGRLVSLRKGKVDIFPMNLKGDLAVRQIEVQPDSSVLAAAIDDGLISLRAGAVQRLNKQNGLPCDGVFGFNRDDRKNWWLSTPCGYVELADSEIQKWRADPKAALQFRLFDALDGARTGRSDFNPAANSPDGRLWFVGALVAQTIEPSRLAKESSARPVYVESVMADHKQYDAQDGLKLAALTHDLQIDYTSPSLANPQKVKFRYRLEGSDSAWQDAGTRRQAFYSNLGPGQYRFTVMASNEDGVWNAQGTTLQFSIAPAWFQTIWFRTLCVVAFFGLLWSLYWMRLRQVRHEFNVSMEARVNERTQIINTVPTLAWSARPDGAAEFFNQRWLDYTGLTLKQAEGWGWKVAIHPDDLDRMLSYWRTAIASGEPVEIEGRLRRFDGESRWFLFRANAVRDESGTIVKWYGTNTDIDDRKRAEEQVRRSEAFLVEGQRLSHTGTYSWRPDTGEITWSKELYRIFEVQPGTPITLDLTLTRIHPDDIPSVREVETRGLQSASDYEHSFRVLLPDGRIKFVHVMARATRDADGRPEFIGAAQDITESKVAEEALNRARSELAHVSRVTTLNALTASITHEINQPLASLLANASSCLRRLNAEPPNVDGARETAQRTIRDANRATDVITRLRALFTKKEFRAETLDLNEVMREVIALSLNDLQRSGVILRSEFAEDLPLVIGDRIQLQQVTLNLLRNASDAMVAVDDRPRQLLIRTQREGDDRVCLNVQDSGCGVNPQDFEKLFEAFYTTKRGGMGIGLSLSRSIIERHHGRLWAEKNDGQPGTTFSFSIPCCPETSKDVSASGKEVRA